MDALWYYNVGAGSVGPVTKDDIVDLFSKRVVSEDTLVWTETFGSAWKKYAEVSEFRPSGPPPLPVGAVSDTWVWIFALVPAFGYFLERALEDNMVVVPLSALFVCYAIAYGVLATLDGRAIQMSGRRKAPPPALLGLMLAPVYLFVRNSRIGKSQITSISWIASFALSMYATNGFRMPFLGAGIPGCASSASVAQVKELFPQIPINLIKATAVEVRDIKTTSTADKKLACTAEVEASGGGVVPVSYTIEDREGTYYYYLSIWG